MGRRRPWQVLRQRVGLAERPSSRSYFTEEEALRSAVAWCLQQPSAVRPLAHILNRSEASPAPGDGDLDEMHLASQSYLVQYSADGHQLMLGTWPSLTAQEANDYVHWAAAGGAGERPRGGPSWRPAEEVISGLRL